ncbi:hypothetical protein A2U01_0004029 [Trifolium medium]|uniref:Uncharacterized protein n=1 Tax=Trifolium medium TaxID=97028 RepID=A0A392M7B7_9FABA|nr:hypothetical protein [Trifolium medium]
MRKSPSQLGANLPPLSRPIGRFNTRSPSVSSLGITRESYFLEARLLTVISLKWAASRTSSSRCRLIVIASVFASWVTLVCRQLGVFTSAGIMVSAPYTILNGVSPVVKCGVVWCLRVLH